MHENHARLRYAFHGGAINPVGPADKATVGSNFLSPKYKIRQINELSLGISCRKQG